MMTGSIHQEGLINVAFSSPVYMPPQGEECEPLSRTVVGIRPYYQGDI